MLLEFITTTTNIMGGMKGWYEDYGKACIFGITG